MLVTIDLSWCTHNARASLALKWFNADGTDEKYEGGRDLDALAEL